MSIKLFLDDNLLSWKINYLKSNTDHHRNKIPIINNN